MMHHQPSLATARATIWICHDCGVEHNSMGKALPPGWDLCALPGSHLDHVRCPDCLERIERDFIAFHAANAPHQCPYIFGPGAQLGIALAGQTGRLERA